MENTMWNGLGYLPTHSGSSICAIFFQLRGSGSLESNTEQLFSRRLFIMQQKRPSGEKADLVTRRENLVEFHLPMVVVDLGDRVVVGRVFVELNEGHRLEIVLGIEDDLAAAQPDDGGCPTAARMPDRTVGATEMERV